MIKGIIFDFDGTLFHTENLGKEVIAQVCSKLKIDFDISNWEKLLGKNREDRINILFPDRKDQILIEFNKEYEKIFADKIFEIGDSLKAIPLLSEQYKLFIFSTKYVSLINAGLIKNNLRKYFLEIIGWETFENKKPHKEGIEYILSKYNFKKDEVVLVGDTNLDKEASENTGIKFVLFDNPHAKRTTEAEIIISNHLDLLQILHKL